jgi:hypothetical protein
MTLMVSMCCTRDAVHPVIKTKPQAVGHKCMVITNPPHMMATPCCILTVPPLPSQTPRFPFSVNDKGVGSPIGLANWTRCIYTYIR